MRYTYMVLVKPKAGREAEWEEWHAKRHVHDMLRVPGIVGCKRYKHADLTDTAAAAWHFLVLYEIEADDPQAVLTEIRRRFGTELMPGTSASDPTATARGLWTLLSEE